MVLYTVSCYSPPSALKIERGDRVKVEGWLKKENIRAEKIENLSKRGPLCQCGTPKVMELITGFPELVTKTGTVKKVIITGESIQFELETSE